MGKVFLKPEKEKRVFSGHPWIFLSDIAISDRDCQPGDVVSIYTRQGRFLARGVYNPKSQIALRILTTQDEPVDRAFIKRRVKRAVDYRRKFADIHSCRLIHAEADGMPGIVTDSFGSVLALQCVSLGMERFQQDIVEALVEEVTPQGVYERNDVPVRRLEGLEQKTGLLYGTVPDRVEMLENGIHFLVDVRQGQKTGYFLDQKENRAAMAPFCPKAKVLDCFSHTGSFALHAAHYGAGSVVAVDISENACADARENASLNGMTNVQVQTANVFDLLSTQAQAGERFDLIILDPPAFAKTRDNVVAATKGYKEINLRAMKMLNDGGYLVTCSCSQHILGAMFKDIVLQAAIDARVNLMQVDFRSQGRDHPILPSSIETQYLKCGIYRVDR